MTAELGQLALVLALWAALAQVALPWWGVRRGDARLMDVAPWAALAQFIFVAAAFGLLIACFVQNDFSVALVGQHSNSRLPLEYRITATWGNHEGSILLWGLVMALWSVAVAVFSRQLDRAMLARVLVVLGAVSAGFLGFTLLTSNPFERHFPAASAAITFSFTPPMGSTRPRRLISPVMAVSLRTASCSAFCRRG